MGKLLGLDKRQNGKLIFLLHWWVWIRKNSLNFLFIDFRERVRERERETLICGSAYLCIHCMCPNQGLNLQPLHIGITF